MVAMDIIEAYHSNDKLLEQPSKQLFLTIVDIFENYAASSVQIHLNRTKHPIRSGEKSKTRAPLVHGKTLTQ